jgi:hypothetical protein
MFMIKTRSLHIAFFFNLSQSPHVLPCRWVGPVDGLVLSADDDDDGNNNIQPFKFQAR